MAKSEGPRGVLPSQTIRKMLETDEIAVERPVDGGQIQPASLDLRLGISGLPRQGLIPRRR